MTVGLLAQVRGPRRGAAAAIMRTRRDELAAWEILECGKPWREADADLAEAIDFLEFYGADWRRIASPRRLGQEPGELNLRLYSPRGVTAIIAPWNFPLAILCGMTTAAIVAEAVLAAVTNVVNLWLAERVARASPGAGCSPSASCWPSASMVSTPE